MAPASSSIIVIITIIVQVDSMLVETGEILRSKEATVVSRVLRGTEDAELMELKDLDIPHLVRETQIIPDECGNICSYHIERKVMDNTEPTEYTTYEPKKCHGWLHGCYTATISENGEYCTADGKLVWVKNFRGYRYGSIDDICTNSNFSQAPYVKGQPCDFCLCMCTAGSSNRTDTTWAVNLQPRTSDVGNHKIIVGIKFRMEKKMIWLDIKEGQLDPSKEGDWRPIDGTNVSRRWVDYSPLMPLTRSIELGLITLPHDYVVTGVKFSKISTLSLWQKSTVSLEVQGTKVDLLRHKLIPSSSKWFNSADKDRFTTSHTKYIIFEDIGWKNGKNVQISPFISQKDVESENNKPLKGVGLTNEWIDVNEQYIKPKIIVSDIHQEFVRTMTESMASTVVIRPPMPTIKPPVTMKIAEKVVEAQPRKTFKKIRTGIVNTSCNGFYTNSFSQSDSSEDYGLIFLEDEVSDSASEISFHSLYVTLLTLIIMIFCDFSI